MLISTDIGARKEAVQTAFGYSLTIPKTNVQEAIEYVRSLIPASGAVGGDLGATDNAVLRADGTGGHTAQGSLVTISDTGIMNGATAVGVNATADTTNRLSVNSAAVLFNHAGAGTQLKANKNASGDTVSHLFQTAFSSRAEFGLIADNDFTLKVSSNGSAFTTALIAANTDGALRVGVNLRPTANDGAALGTTSVGWADLFGATGFTWNIANGNWVATHTSGILTVGTGDLRVTTAGTNAASVVTVSGTQTLTAKTLTSPVINTGTIGTSLLPTANDGAALGASGTAFADLFLASGGVINWNNGNYTLTHSAGLLTANGALSIGTGNAFTCGTIELGAASDTTISRSAAGVIAVEGVPLFAGIPQNSQSTAYTTVLADAQKHILHPTADNNARTFTIAANASVAYPVGTAITFVNQINTVTIAINSDTLTLAGAGTTGSRTLAANGIATALKITSTSWIISGTGLT